MATPTSFVYCWTDHKEEKLYVGSHKGSIDDGYICSSKHMLEQYQQRPQDFTRQIIAEGDTYEEMRNFEATILLAENAALSKDFYNRSNGNKNFVCTGHTDETKQKFKERWAKSTSYHCDHDAAIAAWTGQLHTDETKELMSKAWTEKRKQISSKRMKKNNPMHNPEKIKQMLETRQRNKKRGK
jgi:hypothetical protein